MEAIIFVSFVAIQYAVRELPERMKHNPKFSKLAAPLAKHHWAVWLGHPAIVQGVHEYIVHLVVYSGYIISSH